MSSITRREGANPLSKKYSKEDGPKKKASQLIDYYDAEDEMDTNNNILGNRAHQHKSKNAAHLRGRQRMNEVNMLGDSDEELGAEFGKLGVNGGTFLMAESTSGEGGEDKENLYRIEPSLVHPSGFKTVRSQKAMDVGFGGFATKKAGNGHVQGRSSLDMPRDSSFHQIGTSMDPPSRSKRPRAKSDDGEHAKRMRMSDGMAYIGPQPQTGNMNSSEMADDDSMDWM